MMHRVGSSEIGNASVNSERALAEAFAALVARDDLTTRRRFYDALVVSRLYITVTDDRSSLMAKALQLKDGRLAIPAFIDETALRRWIPAPTRFGTMPAVTFFLGAAKMGVDAVIINPTGPVLEIDRPSIILLGRGLNPAAIPPAPPQSS